ncbi:MAG TPA: type IV pilus secretin PilQ [Desulfobacteraceae bacterium]|nr:type IV pilus secretin PilQ [Desulfobacteraceae bacterium]
MFSGCTALEKRQESAATTPALEKNSKKMVTEIETVQTADRVEVKITGSGKLAYTSVKRAFPLGVVVYLPATGIADALHDLKTPRLEGISNIAVSFADKERDTAMVEVLLKENLAYEVKETDNLLRVIFYKNGVNPSLADEDSAGDFPADESGVVHVPLETSSTGNVPARKDQVPVKENRPGEFSRETAVLDGIDFRVKDDGRSEIVATTSRPVRYEIKKAADHKLRLDLYNTDVPDYRERPLMTKYFRSAVERLLPVNRQTGEKASRITITLREKVPYRVAREKNKILLYFEPSTIPPPSCDMAKAGMEKTGDSDMARSGEEETGDRSGTKTDAGTVPQVLPGKDSPGQQAGKRDTDLAFQEKNEFTGEKIRLDFFETDIKNVFRILQSVSGKNFAVDRDVTGNVTLTLDKPVPWDQVLDLVLKMNRLGKVQEGSIIRIATRATLQQEEEMRQAALEAKKRAVEQQKSLEPLVTEYIAINYSDVQEDIQPHLEKILTPDRGKLSVDTRTNMIIMTDTRAKIDQAKELIYRLDKVTPQIMISAKVVEVSKNFSKKLGIDWGMSSQDVYRDDLGGSYGFDVSMNHAVASNSSIGYTFSRITGTPFSLNARLTASEIKGDVKIVSSPRVLTLDNKKAKIKQGLEYAYLERDDSGGSSVSFKDIDLLLEVTPHVTPDQRIAMSVFITKNDIDSVTDGVPSLSTNEAETELLINDGNTIVIGGIVKTTSSENISGFPLLADIPGLGKLFGSDSEEEKRNELLIFITPTIVQLEQKRNED